MHIQLETPDKNTILSYTDEQVTVEAVVYQGSVIIGRHSIIFPWPIHSVIELTEASLEPMLHLKPEIIIIGHQQPSVYLPMSIMQYLSKFRIGIECMSIGAACRTFNVLLSEQRNVIAGIIFK